MVSDRFKKAGLIAALGASIIAGGKAQAKEADLEKNSPAPMVEAARGPEIPNGLWNGLKKVIGLPYQETEYWNAEEAHGFHNVKSTTEHSLWGLWTYKKDSYASNGTREETRYYDGNTESHRDEFHPTGQKSWTGEIRDGHPFGRVKEYNLYGQQTFEGNYDLDGKPDGVHKEIKAGIVTHETPYSHGIRQGEERQYNDQGSLQKIIPWDNNQKNGVEQNLENGDFTTWNSGVRNGSFQETVVSGPYNNIRIVKSGHDEAGIRHVQFEKEYRDGSLYRETSFDSEGRPHGEERIANGLGFDINPYNHGVLHGRQTKGLDFTTYENGIPNGPYRLTSNPLSDDNFNPIIGCIETGVWKDGEQKVSSREYSRYQLDATSGIAGISISEEEAFKEIRQHMHEGKSNADLLKAHSQVSAGQKIPATPSKIDLSEGR